MPCQKRLLCKADGPYYSTIHPILLLPSYYSSVITHAYHSLPLSLYPSIPLSLYLSIPLPLFQPQ